MKSWEDRPPEIASLLNPAFCGQVLWRAIDGYSNECDEGFPYPLSYLVLPVVLHKQTREEMSGHTRQLHDWLHQNKALRVGFHTRAQQLAPLVPESIRFLWHTEVLELGPDESLRSLPQPRKQAPTQREGEVDDCFSRAELLGKWYARAGDVPTVYTMWGVRP